MKSHIFVVVTWLGVDEVDFFSSIDKFANHVIINTQPKRWSVAKAWNYAMEKYLRTAFDVVIICNDDITLREDTASILIDNLRDNVVMTTAYNPAHFPDFKESIKFSNGEIPGMHCFAVDKRLVEQVGWFDEGYEQAFFEDTDMFTRILRAKKDIVICAPVDHIESGTIKNDPERAIMKEQIYPKNLQRYIDKWGGPPDPKVVLGGGPYLRTIKT